MPNEYAPPVDRLFQLEKPGFIDEPWMDYPGELGLTSAHVPELIRAATAPNFGKPVDGPEIWAAAHAWRALAQLGATEAAEPLAALLGPDPGEWLQGDLAGVLESMGPAVVPALAGVVVDATRDDDAVGTAAASLVRIARKHPETRDAAVSALQARLRDHAANSIEVNTLVGGALLDLAAAEAVAELEAVYASGRLDTWATGDWEDAQVDLGLIPARTRPRDVPLLEEQIRRITQRRQTVGVGRHAWGDEPPSRLGSAGPGSAASRKERDRARARKKMAKKSRKQNRR